MTTYAGENFRTNQADKLLEVWEGIESEIRKETVTWIRDWDWHEHNFGARDPIKVWTKSVATTSGQGYKGARGAGNLPYAEEFVLTPCFTATPIDIWFFEKMMVRKKGGGAITDLETKAVKQGLQNHWNSLDRDVHISKGPSYLARITTGASSTTQTCDFVKNSATYSGWSGSKFLEPNMTVAILDSTGAYKANGAGSYVHTVSSRNIKAGTVVFAGTVDLSSGEPYYLVACNANDYATSNSYLQAISGFPLLADSHNVARQVVDPADTGNPYELGTLGCRLAGKVMNVTRDDNNGEWSQGVHYTAENFSTPGTPGTAIAVDADTLIAFATEGARNLMDSQNEFYPDYFRGNLGVYTAVYNELFSAGITFENKLGDKFGYTKAKMEMRTGSLDFVIDPRVPDSTLFAPMMKFLHIAWNLKPMWNPDGQRMAQKQGYYANSDDVLSILEAYTEAPFCQAIMTDILQTIY